LQFIKSIGPYDSNLAGAVTVSAAFVSGIESGVDNDNRVIMAVAGRIPLKVTGESGSIEPGDFIAAASSPGYGMKAVQAGRVVGMALQSFDAATSTATSSILVLINPHWYVPQVSVEDLQGGSLGTGPTLNTYTFDPNTVYSFENLKVQHIEIGSSDNPSGITIYDVVTKNPYCIISENGILKSVPGKCGEGATTGLISTSTFTNSNSTTPISSDGNTATSSPQIDTAQTATVINILGGSADTTSTTPQSDSGQALQFDSGQATTTSTSTTDTAASRGEQSRTASTTAVSSSTDIAITTSTPQSDSGQATTTPQSDSGQATTTPQSDSGQATTATSSPASLVEPPVVSDSTSLTTSPVEP